MSNLLMRLAPLHVAKGMKNSHIDAMKGPVIAVHKQILGKEFDGVLQAAWDWLWAWLAKLMKQSLDNERYEVTTLSMSMDLAMENFPDEQVLAPRSPKFGTTESCWPNCFHFAARGTVL